MAIVVGASTRMLLHVDLQTVRDATLDPQTTPTMIGVGVVLMEMVTKPVTQMYTDAVATKSLNVAQSVHVMMTVEMD